jgi:hypothetical protein
MLEGSFGSGKFLDCAPLFQRQWRDPKPNTREMVILYDRVMARPRVAAYLSSPRRRSTSRAFSGTIPRWKRDRRERYDEDKNGAPSAAF